MLRIGRIEDPGGAAKQHVPEPPPIFPVVVDEKSGSWVVADVLQASQFVRIAFGLGIDRVVDGVAEQNEAHRHEADPRAA